MNPINNVNVTELPIRKKTISVPVIYDSPFLHIFICIFFDKGVKRHYFASFCYHVTI
jgi:hypothetical protein